MQTNRSERKHKAVGSPKPEKVPEKRERYIVFIGELDIFSSYYDFVLHLFMLQKEANWTLSSRSDNFFISNALNGFQDISYRRQNCS